MYFSVFEQMKDVIIRITEVLLGIAIIAFLVVFYLQTSEYKKSSEEYEELTGFVSQAPPEEKTLAQELSEAGIPALAVDFEGLLAKNPDTVGWISLPGLGISYPVVQGEDDEYYLHRTFEGEENSSGCIFLESLSKTDLSDYNTFLFGHNMKNGTMFGSLKRYANEEGLYAQAPDFFYYTPEASYRFRIYSYYITAPDSHTYYLCENPEEYGDYVKMALEESVFDCGVDVDTAASTMTLATCSGTGRAKKRFVVHGIMAAKVSNR